jgi:hypothetical protein
LRPDSYLLGPLRTLAGSMMMALNNSSTALTEIPKRRKGRRRSQMIGYKRRAKRARGQQSTNKMSQRKNLINVFSFMYEFQK